MSKRKYAVATMAAVSGCLLVAAQAPIAGAVAAASGVSGDVSITNTETVDAKLTADGKVSSQRIYDQLVLKGDGSVEVDNPVADGARNLNGFGGLSVRDGKQRIATKVNGEKAYRTVAITTVSCRSTCGSSTDSTARRSSPRRSWARAALSR